MNPIYRKASYALSAHNLKQLPEDSGGEVAVAGRSNAGKSTAINAICDQKALARTSKTPGRTQQMVIFELDEDNRLVDLPGYGFAKVPEQMRRHWNHVLDGYFRSRKSLQGLILVMDIRHALKEGDIQMLEWSDAAELPCHVLLTKGDKLNNQAKSKALSQFKQQVQLPLVTVQVFSGMRKQGVDQVHTVLDQWLGYASNS